MTQILEQQPTMYIWVDGVSLLSMYGRKITIIGNVAHELATLDRISPPNTWLDSARWL